MANQSYIGVSGTTLYRKATGTGTDVDPYITEFNEPSIGETADAAATTDTGTFSLISLFKRLLQKLPALESGRIPVALSGGGGGGTEYADGATAATPTGTVAMGNKSGVAKAVQIDSNNYLQVSAPDLTNKFGTVGDAALSTGTVLQQLRLIAESMPGNKSVTTTAINESVSGDRTIISPTAAKKIAISSLYFTVSNGVNVTLKDGSTSISGAMQLTDHAGDYPHPIILSTNTAFVINVSATANLRGYVVWYLI